MFEVDGTQLAKALIRIAEKEAQEAAEAVVRAAAFEAVTDSDLAGWLLSGAKIQATLAELRREKAPLEASRYVGTRVILEDSDVED